MADEQGGATATAAKKTTEPRDYMVLGQLRAGVWDEIGVERATTDKKAIAPFAVKNEARKAQIDTEGETQDSVEVYEGFVAVPLRSWHPRNPRAKTDPQLSWS